MAEKEKRKAVVTGTARIAEGIYSIWIKEEALAGQARAGQFLSLFCSDESRMLPRPISICEIDRENGLLRLVFRLAGKGTEEFSRLAPGDFLEVMGPLGNGFTPEGKKALVIGGGIGIPPLLELSRELQNKEELTIVLGYKKELFLKEDFEPFGAVLVSTEDGSAGTKGNVLDVLERYQPEADMIYACGPALMLKGIKEYALRAKIPAQLSMEERMACGIGACLACVCASVEKDPHTNVKNKRVCKDGPVFYASDIIL